jgi:2-phosphosulfolactate phosphatase
MVMIFSQSEFDIRCEWGENGVAQLASVSDAVVIVDVLSFSTCVEIAARRGAVVFPYRGQGDGAEAFAASVGAELAGSRRSLSSYSLSPASLVDIPKGARLVLPSPNGATLTLGTGGVPTLAGCLRNYRAVASAAQKSGRRLAIIPAGERWPDGSLRPALEDWIGAGAIVSQLHGELSPEARAARAAFHQAQTAVESSIRQCGSGKELIARGFEEDVRLASALNVSECAPLLADGAYRWLGLSKAQTGERLCSGKKSASTIPNSGC